MNKVFEILFEDFETIGQAVGPGADNTALLVQKLDALREKQIIQLLDTYSMPALQRMAQGRSISDPKLKKQILAAKLAARFYETASTQRGLQSLSAAARDGLARIKRAGGLIRAASWRAQMIARHGQKGMEQAQLELGGAMLAFYGMRYLDSIEFTSSYKHDLHTSNEGGENLILWSYPKVLNSFKPDPQEQTKPLEPYNPKAGEIKVSQEARFESLLADVIAFIRYTEQNKPKVLQSGDIGKRDYNKLNELMAVKETRDLKASKKLDEIGRLNFLWNVLSEARLVTTANNGWEQLVQVSAESNAEFYELPRYRQARLLTAAWVRSNFNDFRLITSLSFYGTPYNMSDVPDRQRLVRARAFIMSFFEELNRQGSLVAGQWLDFKSLVRLLQDTNPDFMIARRSPPPANYYYNYYSYEGYFGVEYYNGFTSKLKTGVSSISSTGGYRLRNEGGLKLAEDFELVEGEWLAQLMTEPLAWLGLFELSRDSKDRPLAFRLTELGQAVLRNQPTNAEVAASQQAQQLAATAPDMNKALLVQPNFDVMVLAPLQNMPLLRQVDRFAGQVSLGDVAMYRITKESVLRGLRTGISGPEVLQVLQENSRVPVAQNIIASIEGWNAEFERLVLYQNANLLEVPGPELMDKLMAYAPATKYLVRRVGPTFALIKGDPVKLENLIQQFQAGLAKGPPLYFDYKEVQPGSLLPEGETLIKVKPHTGNPYVYYRLGQFAELVSWDAATQSATFLLSAAAGQRAQRTGLTFDNVLSFLIPRLPSQVTKGFVRPASLPPAMVLALKGWLGYYSPLTGEKAITLQATQSSQLDEIFALEEFKPALINRAGPKTALVRESHFAALRTRLAELGLLINAPDFDPPALPAPVAEPELVAAEPAPLTATGRGRAPKGKPKLAKVETKPKESAAERERRQREASEDAALSNPFGLGRPDGFPIVIPVGPGRGFGSSGGPPSQTELMEVIQTLGMLARGDIPMEALLDNDDLYLDDEDDGPFIPRGRPRRR